MYTHNYVYMCIHVYIYIYIDGGRQARHVAEGAVQRHALLRRKQTGNDNETDNLVR